MFQDVPECSMFRVLSTPQSILTFAVRAVESVWMNINRVTLQHNKEFIMFIF